LGAFEQGVFPLRSDEATKAVHTRRRARVAAAFSGAGPAPAASTSITSRRHGELQESFPRTGPFGERLDTLMVGAGFAGCVLAERLASQAGQRVLVVDRRTHIGGNAHDRYDDAGLLVHPYRPHIFHTNSAEVVVYLSQFTAWRPYQHRVLASVDGQLLPMPINLDTVNRLYGLQLSSFQMEGFLANVAETVERVRNAEDMVVARVGRDLYEKFFRGYTRKQWGLDPSELDASVTARVPTRTGRDDRYFTDTYQAMPLHGYTRMFQAMLAHRRIHLMLSADYRDIAHLLPWKLMVYTGPIDSFFDHRHGRLPYCSLHFEHVTRRPPAGCDTLQSAGTLNHPNDHLYTRVTEFKHLTGQAHEQSSLVYEYPRSEGEPFYPVPRAENTTLYRRYEAEAEQLSDVSFVGRLASYKYYNMDQVVAQALSTFRWCRPEASARPGPGACLLTGRRSRRHRRRCRRGRRGRWRAGGVGAPTIAAAESEGCQSQDGETGGQ
jgi:UDP-galactopyranose mutase